MVVSVIITSGPISLCRKRRPLDPVSTSTSLGGPLPTETVTRLAKPLLSGFGSSGIVTESCAAAIPDPSATPASTSARRHPHKDIPRSPRSPYRRGLHIFNEGTIL